MARVDSPTPVPVATLEMVSPPAPVAKLMFTEAVADAVGVNRTVTGWVAPTPTRLNVLPETMVNGAEVDTVPETVPPTVFETVRTCSVKLPTFTLPKFMVPVGLTSKTSRATALAGVEQALSPPLESTAVTAMLKSRVVLSPVILAFTVWLGAGLGVEDANCRKVAPGQGAPDTL
jgi:hypothetical protein